MVKFYEGAFILGDLGAKLTLPNHVKNNPFLAIKRTQSRLVFLKLCGYSGLLGHTAAILGPSDGYKRTIREVIVRI